ncbi:MAG: RnfABCDGE type electron transport complex subunit D [Clostridia bacterium]|nr:RnfABCDGE type electron transport complex subunit D [Clostridia bacterium]
MFERSEQTRTSLAVDLLISCSPIAVWAVFLYGGRAAMLMALCGFFTFLFEIPVRFLKKKRGASLFSLSAFVSGVLASFLLPVTVPLWIPILTAALTVLCRSFTGYFAHRLFNPAVFSVFTVTLLFPGYLERYTRPFAYFPAFDMVLDPDLVNAYRVFSPLQLLNSGMFYEDGMLSQLFGVSIGPIGAVAVLCLVLSLVWLILRRNATILSSLSYILTIAVLFAAFSPDDIEMVSYSGLHLLSGSVVFLCVFAMNDLSSAPNPAFRYARLAFGLTAGILTYVFRLFGWGLIGDYLPILIVNLLTPVFEKLSNPFFLADVRKAVRRKP